MALTLSFSNIAEEFAKAKQKLERELAEHALVRTPALLKDLAEATPIKTGFARESWSLHIKSDGKTAEINNTAPYIEDLNAGSSKQAPAFFIERIALRYGEADGVIVDVIK